MEITITSRKNPLLTHIRKLVSSQRYRKESGEYLCEGTKLLHTALSLGAEITTLCLTPDLPCPEVGKDTTVVRLPGDVLQSLSTHQTPQGALFLVKEPTYTLPSLLSQGRYLALDGVQDSGNVGTLWRTAQGLGATGLILLEHCANPWGHKTVRSSMGACFTFPVYQMTGAQLLSLTQTSQLPLYATALKEDSVSCDLVDFSSCVVVIGSEGQGVSAPLLAQATQTIYLPMHQGCQSLNAAIAGGILLWEMGKSCLA